MYRRASLVVAVREPVVEGSVKVTVAPATAAPEGSVTVPTIVPVATACENRAVGHKTNKQSKTPANRPARLRDIQLPPHRRKTKEPAKTAQFQPEDSHI